MDNFKKAVGEEVFNLVVGKLGKDAKVYLQADLDGSWIPKNVFDERIEKLKETEKSLNEQLTAQKDEYEKQIKDTQKKISELEPLATTNTELSEKLKAVQAESAAKVQEYDEKLKTQKEEAEKTINETMFNSKVRDKVRASGAMKDSQLNAVLANIDLSKVSNDEKLTGLSEQIDGLKVSDPSFFGETKIIGDPPPKAGPLDSEISFESLRTMSAEDILKVGVDKANAAAQTMENK